MRRVKGEQCEICYACSRCLCFDGFTGHTEGEEAEEWGERGVLTDGEARSCSAEDLFGAEYRDTRNVLCRGVCSGVCSGGRCISGCRNRRRCCDDDGGRWRGVAEEKCDRIGR